MPSGEYVVHEGRRKRDPHHPLRIVREDGSTIHVMHKDHVRYRENVTFLPLADAVAEAFRLGGLPLSDGGQ